MAFNVGAFAAGMAKGGIDTYSNLTDIEAKALETEQRRKEIQGKEALRAAIAEQGDMNTATPGATMAGPAPQGLPQEGGYAVPETSTADKLARVRQRALEGGADPTAVMQYANLQRADTSAFNAQKAFTWMQDSNKAVAEKGLVKAAEDYLIPHYNSNKGLLNDGMTAKVVNTDAGPIVQFSDAKGNIQNNMTKPLTMETFNQYRDVVGSSMLAAAGPEHFYKAQELGLKREEVGLKGREVTAKEKLLPSEIAKNNAAANQANAHASVYSTMLQTAKDSKEAGKAMQPFLDEFAQMSPEDQNGPKGQAVLLKGATAGAQKSKDLAGIVSMLRKPDRAAVSAEQEKAAYAAYNEATTEAQIEAVKAKYPAVFGEDPALAAIKNAYADKGKGKDKAGKKAEPATSAIPVDKDEIPIPGAARTTRAPYSTIDARGILRTPSYSAGATTFNPKYDD